MTFSKDVWFGESPQDVTIISPVPSTVVRHLVVEKKGLHAVMSKPASLRVRLFAAMKRARAPLYAIPHAWRASKGAFLCISLVLAVQGLLPPVMTVLLGQTVEVFTDEGSPAPQTLALLAAAWGGVLLLGIGLQPLVFSLSGRINEDLSTYLQKLLLDKGQSLRTLEFFDDPDTYDIVSLVVKEAKSRPVNYIVLYTYILRASVSLVAFIVIIWTVSWLAPIVLLISAIPLTFAFTSIREANWGGIRARADQARFLDYLSSVYLQRDLFWDTRLNNTNAFMQDQFQATRASLLSFLRRQRRRGIVKNLPLIIIGAFGYTVSITLLLVQAGSAGVAVAALTAALQAYISLQATVNEVVENLAFLNEKAFFFRDLNTFLDKTEMTGHDAAPGPVGRAPDSDSGHIAIELSGVTYHYPSSTSQPSVVDASFIIREGETVAIVGENGAGKSTVLKLIAGACFPDNGAVLTDGEPLCLDNVDAWRTRLSVVPQRPSTFSFSVGENIAFGEVGDDRVRESLEQVSSDGSLDSSQLLGVEYGGVELSGGETQRLAIARAVVRDTPVLLLDEPTSAIDPVFEARLFDDLRTVMKDRTAIIVTHRLPQALAADKVVVMHKGEIAETGTPAALIEAEGLFAEMCREQRRILRLPGNP